MHITNSALEVIFYNEMRYINLHFTYLLTYLQPSATTNLACIYIKQSLDISDIKSVYTKMLHFKQTDPGWQVQ